MTRSRKKPYCWLSRPGGVLKRRAYRHHVKQVCHEVEREIEFDPDRDWELAFKNEKEFGSWGTWFGYPVGNLLDGDLDDGDRKWIEAFSRK